MTIEESSIFINLKRLRRRLYGAQFNMGKADRIIYGTPLMESCGRSIAAFVLAFTVKEKRVEYLEECIGHFTVLRTDLEFCTEQNMIKWSHRAEERDKDGKPIPWTNPEDKVNSQKIELFRLIGKIDGGMCKWRASLAKGKTVCAEEHTAD